MSRWPFDHKLRIGAVSFLNTVPLVEWFHQQGADQVDLERHLPSRLSTLLSHDQVDVALLPVVEVFRGRSGGLFPETGIAGKGPVDSVKIAAHGPLQDLAIVQVDRGSRSSVALLEVLLRETLGFCPLFREIEPRPGILPDEGEGLLVIGDRCLEYEARAAVGLAGDLGFHDLGQMWTELTGLPFVFAAWSVSPGFLDRFGQAGVEALRNLLVEARNFGLDNLALLAKREAEAGHLGFQGQATPAAVEHYFRTSLRYVLGAEEMAGLRKFKDLCVKHELVPPNLPLKIL